jgi:hypothetical protein
MKGAQGNGNGQNKIFDGNKLLTAVNPLQCQRIFTASYGVPLPLSSNSMSVVVKAKLDMLSASIQLASPRLKAVSDGEELECGRTR